MEDESKEAVTVETEQEPSQSDDGLLATSEVAKRLHDLEQAMREQYAKNADKSFDRGGDRIRLPVGMSPGDAIEHLQTANDAEEPQVYTEAIVGHPDDVSVATMRVISRRFGKMISVKIESFFGTIPARSRKIAVGFDETVDVPEGKLRIPGTNIYLSIGAVPTFMRNSPNVDVPVTFFAPRMYEKLIESIFKEIRKEIRTRSIFMGKAIDTNFEFLDLRADTSILVHSASEMAQLEAHIYTPIRQRKKLRALGVSPKRVILLEGTYGTGKTLTATDVAKEAVKEGYTFIMVKSSSMIGSALEFADKLQPAVVFVEDIDRQTSGTRDEDMDNLLNTIDGALSKNSEIMVIMTTNDVKSIHPAMKRPGRIDKIIHLGDLDRDAVERLVKVYGRGRLSDAIDYDAVYKAAEGLTPAFVAGASEEALLYALSDSARRGNKSLVITQSNLINAFNGVRPTFEETQIVPPKAKPDVDEAILEIVRSATMYDFSEVRNDISRIDESIDRLDTSIERLIEHIMESGQN